ncbi:MAG: cbb3-type cytochrome c oxidase subunit I [Candidatus Sericytochromatia bacterium]
MALSANPPSFPNPAGPQGQPQAVPAGAHPRLTLLWTAAAVVLFVAMLALGAAMRAVQGSVAPAIADRFYALMTLHGLGMAGAMFVGAMAVASYFMGRYIETSARASAIALGGTLLGVVILAFSTLVGGFGAGWYFLHPLPFSALGGWPLWTAYLFMAGMAVLGASWLLWTISILRGVAARYPLSRALGWHYITGKKGEEVPPLVLISTVALIAVFAALVAAVVIVVLFLTEGAQGKPNDPLMMKNLIFFFGHTLVNITMYFGVAVVYELMPEYFGRPWPANRVVAISWNTVLALVLLAYLHHLYMDFAQPPILQAIGQIASYTSALPAAVVSIYGGLMLVARAKARWTLTSSFLFLGLLGWCIGGIAAVTDSTIMANFRFHNTLWVPGHFHAYMLLGVCMMMLGAAYRVVADNARVAEARGVMISALYVLGGYGIVLMFYAGGADGIPRRFALYPAELGVGAFYAQLSLVFVVFLVLGVAGYLWEAGRHWFKAYARA